MAGKVYCNRDKAGQETSLTATGYKDLNQWTNRDVNAFANNIKYRAWGGIKQFTNGALSLATNSQHIRQPPKMSFGLTTIQQWGVTLRNPN